MNQPKRVYNATKTAMRQGSNGIEITLKFNLDGDEIDLVALPLSGRVFITCEPDPASRADIRKVVGARTSVDGPAVLNAPVGHTPLLDPVRHAAMLSRDGDFQSWVGKQTNHLDLTIWPEKLRETFTANWIRDRLRISSRADLAVDDQARNRYTIMLSEYRTENPNGGPEAA